VRLLFPGFVFNSLANLLSYMEVCSMSFFFAYVAVFWFAGRRILCKVNVL
jgi:hypothetical protein